MAGVKGRSGGARSGAGRPRKKVDDTPKAPPPLIEADNMLDLLQKVALGQVEATALQVRAAIAAVQYTHAKKGEGGKKGEKNAAARKASAGKYAPAAAPPRLVVNNS
ncbi:hypothetical protein D3C86_1352070 [compost metagenome]